MKHNPTQSFIVGKPKSAFRTLLFMAAMVLISLILAQPQISRAAGIAVIYRVNVGGPQLNAADASLPVWSADDAATPSPYINTGSTISAPYAGAINMTHASMTGLTQVPMALFQTQRFDAVGGNEMMWMFPVTTGQQYKVRLYFAETAFTAANLRKFNIAIEGTTVQVDLDIFAAAAGKDKALMREFTVVMADANLNIDLPHGTVNNPALRGIEIIQSPVVPALTVTPNPVAFGNALTGTTTPQIVTLTNSGTALNADITITAITIGGANANQFNTPALVNPIVLTPGQSQTITVNFAPTTAGAKAGTLQVANNGSTGPTTNTPMTGTGIAPSPLNVPAAPVNFGNVTIGSAGQQTIVVTHGGAAGSPNINITAITLMGADAAEFNTAALVNPIVLTPGQTSNIIVNFAPATAGNKTANLQVTHTGSNGPTGNVVLNGVSVALPALATYRINVGGPQLNAPDASLPVWSVDTAAAPSPYVNAGSTVSATYAGAINMTHASLTGLTYVPMAMFQTQRFDPVGGTEMMWNFPVTAGQTYKVRLFFAETFHNAANLRRFNVNIEGVAVLTNFDIFTTAGGKDKGIMQEFTIPMADGNLDLDFIHGALDNPAVRGIEVFQSVPVPASTLGITPNPIAFGNVTIGAPGTQVVTLTNTGTAAINVTAIASNNLVFTHNAVLPMNILAGQTATFNVVFTPTAVGAQNGILTVTHNGTNGPTITANITGTGLAAPASTLGITPNPIAFGNVTIGAPGTQAVTLTNTGTAAINVTAIASNNLVFTHNAVLPMNILAGQTATFNVVFTSTAVGAQNGILTVTHNGTNGPTITANITGTGLAAPASTLGATPNPIAFGNVTIGAAPGTQVVTLTNTGTAAIAVSAVVSDNVVFTHNAALPINILAGQTATFNAIFTPTAAGAQGGNLTITHNGVNGPTLVVPMTGTGVAPIVAVLTINPNPVNFGAVIVGAPASSLNVVLTNAGAVGAPSILISSLTLGGADAAQFQLTPLGAPVTLPAGQSYSFAVGFAPNAAGNFAATITVAHDNGTATPTNAVINVTGSATAPVASGLQAAPLSLNFGVVTLPSDPNAVADPNFALASPAQSVTLTYNGNVGDPAVTISGVTLTGANADSFRHSFTAPITLNVGDSTSITVTFTPFSAGAKVASLDIAHNGANGPLTSIGLQGTVNGTTAPVVVPTVVPPTTTTAPAATGSVTISKSVMPPFALPGNTVTWTITVINPNSAPVANVTVTDNVPADLEILSTSASSGTASANGQSVSATIPQIDANQTVTISIQTRIRATTSLPFSIRNEACAGAQCSSAQILSVSALPSTGQSPWSAWRLPLFGLFGGAMLLSVMMASRRLQKSS